MFIVQPWRVGSFFFFLFISVGFVDQEDGRVGIGTFSVPVTPHVQGFSGPDGSMRVFDMRYRKGYAHYRGVSVWRSLEII
jgi:hypothetical protein